MAHHQHAYHDRLLTSQGLSSGSLHGSAGASATGDDDLASDVDEPPDKRIQFAKLKTPSIRSFNSSTPQDSVTSPHLTRDRKESLLTQALLSSPELNPISDTEAPVLTSDGGLTSPARTTSPSPPLPSALTGLPMAVSKGHRYQTPDHSSDTVKIAPTNSGESSHETGVEAGLGRKRCISFACGRQSASQKASEVPAKTQARIETPTKPVSPAKRPCMLKFVCPMKPSHADPPKREKRGKSPCPVKQHCPTPEVNSVNTASEVSTRTHRDSDSTIKSSPCQNISVPATNFQSRKGRVFNRIDFQESEATRFHEFECHFSTEDEWTNEQTAYRQKITVNDTLRKENAIRKLAEEAEEEALDEEAEEEIADDDNGDEDLSDIDVDTISDDGNETDDEEGFADSDEESDGDSDYHFWTPGLTTAATSTDHLEHIRPAAHRITSDSSIESTIDTTKIGSSRNSREYHVKSPRLAPSTPDLPDSSDFVVGTVDEDRPLEEAYMSCLEERRRSKHTPIPQDIDPSFPTSDPEAGNNEEEDDDEDDNVTRAGDAAARGRGHPETPEHAGRLFQGKIPTPIGGMELSMLSPKRIKSPTPKRLQSPPSKRVSVHRSPPPRRLFGHSTLRLRSPPPTRQRLTSPPSSRRPSIDGSPSTAYLKIDMPHLAQRPNLTHTTSLPRTPNPFWDQHRRSRFHGSDTPSSGTSPKGKSVSRKRADTHSRGPIDIVQGLETKRQRRKDKFWRQHCRTAGREKHRKCQPGKGAERMKELGLEMADRFRGYGQKAPLVLSV